MADTCRNTSGWAGVTRRRLLQSAPAVLAGATVPFAVSAAISESPVRAIFQQWNTHRSWLNGPDTDDMPEPEFDAAVNVSSDYEKQMMAIPARDASDVLMKIAAYTDWGSGDLASQNHLPALWAEIQAFVVKGGAA